MLAALLTQFPHGAFQTRFWTFLRTPKLLNEALENVAQAGGLIVHAMVSPDSKQRIADFCRIKRIHCKDLTGGFVEFLAEASGLTPSSDWRDLHRTDEAYHRRLRAVEFTLAHDDGLGLPTLNGADIVLVGVSRTTKTPTSIYLSQLGYRTANVALAMGIDPPRELIDLPKGKVVGLVIDAQRLAAIRTRRQAEWRMSSTSYDELDTVKEEVAWSRKLFLKQGWPVIDVTNHAIEETAGRILDILNLPRLAG
jgi:[pyruvate, water dikinase]-phosphate phosphotransferase / [pyruvate, water dikinase] kinase